MIKHTLKGSVGLVLSKVPAARENDRVLYAEFIKEWHKNLIKNGTVKLEDFTLMADFAIIARYRRYFQKAGDYLPKDPAVIERRKLADQVMREKFSPSHP